MARSDYENLLVFCRVSRKHSAVSTSTLFLCFDGMLSIKVCFMYVTHSDILLHLILKFHCKSNSNRTRILRNPENATKYFRTNKKRTETYFWRRRWIFQYIQPIMPQFSFQTRFTSVTFSNNIQRKASTNPRRFYLCKQIWIWLIFIDPRTTIETLTLYACLHNTNKKC